MSYIRSNIDSFNCKFFGIPKNILPEIRSSGEHYGFVKSGVLKGVPVTAVNNRIQ